MFSALVVLFRLVAGLVILAGTWFVFDTIHDRNTEIIVATIGLLYSFIFIISGRLQYFGLTVFSFFGRTSSYVQKIPYDHMMRDEVGLRTPQRIYIPQSYFCGVDRVALSVSPLLLAFGPRLGYAVRTDPHAPHTPPIGQFLERLLKTGPGGSVSSVRFASVRSVVAHRERDP